MNVADPGEEVVLDLEIEAAVEGAEPHIRGGDDLQQGEGPRDPSEPSDQGFSLQHQNLTKKN